MKANTTQALNDPSWASSEICETRLATWALKNEQDFLTHKPWLSEKKKKDLKKQIFLNRKTEKH